MWLRLVVNPKKRLSNLVSRGYNCGGGKARQDNKERAWRHRPCTVASTDMRWSLEEKW